MYSIYAFDKSKFNFPSNFNYTKIKEEIDEFINQRSQYYLSKKNSNKVIKKEDLFKPLKNVDFNFSCHKSSWKNENRSFKDNFEIELGEKVHNNVFLKKVEKIKTMFNSLSAHNLIVGSPGSGCYEFMLGLAEQVVKNDYGVTFIDNRGDFNTYSNIENICEQANRKKDLFVLNFIPDNYERTYSVDPINEILEYSPESFLDLFVDVSSDEQGFWKGKILSCGKLIIDLCLELKAKNILIDSSFLLLLCNLDTWFALLSPEFSAIISEELRDKIKQSIQSMPGVEFSEEKDYYAYSLSSMEQFGYLFMYFQNIVLPAFKAGEDLGVFSINPTASFFDILLNKKILAVIMPTLNSNKKLVNIWHKILFTHMKAYNITKLYGKFELEEQNNLKKSKGKNLIFFTELPSSLDDSEITHIYGKSVMSAQSRSCGNYFVFHTQNISDFYPVKP